MSASALPSRRPDFRQPRGPATWPMQLRIWLATVCGIAILITGTLFALLISIATLFRARRFCAERIAAKMSRLALRLYGVTIVEHSRPTSPERPVVFISNHTSSLDVPVIIALGLPNSRYFMSGFLRKIVPLWLLGELIGIFWTANQKFPERRTRIFQDAEARLRRTGESVFLTPEGQCTWRFNKGAFHLATSLQAPIVPLFIRIPNEVDPGPWDSGEFHAVRPGVVDVFWGEPIDTSDWSLTTVERHRDDVRTRYIAWAKALGIDDAEQQAASQS